MLEFKKTCNDVEKLSIVAKNKLITEKTKTILKKLSLLKNNYLDNLNTLAAYMIGAAYENCEIDEKEYLLIYPALLEIFGKEFDFLKVKNSFKTKTRGILKKITDNMISMLSNYKQDFKNDVIILCLCVFAYNGRISNEERKYLKKIS